jgi:hypothetical protein
MYNFKRLKMTTTIDFRTMPASVPSLCIPRVFPNIDERRIRGIFDSLNMGEILRVDIVRKHSDKKGENFNRVFIHWKRWNDSENANNSRERLLNGKEIKIIYDDPWFWKISAYREPISRPTTINSKRRPIVNPRLEFDSEKPVSRLDPNVSVFEPRTPNCSPPRASTTNACCEEEEER